MELKPNAKDRRQLHRIDWSETDFGALSTAYESAMTEGGGKIRSATVSKPGREMTFTVRPQLPTWADQLTETISMRGDNGSFDPPTGRDVPDGVVSVPKTPDLGAFEALFKQWLKEKGIG